MKHKNFLNLELDFKKKIISLDFLEKPDYIKSLKKEENFIGKSLEDIISIKSSSSGICLNLSSIFELSELIVFKLKQVSKKNIDFTFNESSLISFFYTLVKVETMDEKIELFYIYKFVSEPVLMSRREWSFSHNISSFDCCLKNYSSLIGKDITIINTSNENQIESCCVYPGCFIDTRCFGWIHVLKPSTKLQLFKKLELNIENPLIDNKFFGYPLQLVFYNTSQQKLKKEIQVGDYFSITNLRNNKQVHYPQSCQDLPISLSIQSTSFENYLISCFLSMFLTQTTLFSKKKKIQISSKILATCFYFE